MLFALSRSEHIYRHILGVAKDKSAFTLFGGVVDPRMFCAVAEGGGPLIRECCLRSLAPSIYRHILGVAKGKSAFTLFGGVAHP